MRIVRNLPIRGKLYCIIGILAFNLIIVIATGVFGMWFLSTLRAYVGGEGLWAKAQKNAIYSLSKYALFHNESDYQAFQDALKVPFGDRKARLELQKLNPDLRVTDAGFMEGGIHAEDTRDIAHLFIRFYRMSYIKTAIQIWSEADLTIDELQKSAQELHQTISSGKASRQDIQRYLKKIDEINDKLTALENKFSYTLGEASRWAKRTLFWVMLMGSAFLGLSGLYASLLISGQIAEGIRGVSSAASKVAGGDLSVHLPVVTNDELGQLADAFNRMTEGLSKLDKLKNDFISTVSHELRTPLTLSLAPLESLLSNQADKLSAEQRTLLEVMHNNTVRLLQMVSGLLDFSKLEARKVEVRREPSDIAALTRNIVEDFRPIAANKKQTLVLELSSPEISVEMDRYLYERILFNLISNAVKFTPLGGRVVVRLDRHQDTLSVAVRDTGIGISERDQETLFQKFRQIESSSTRRFEGTGLGLALVKEFCRLLGGRIDLKSKLGWGSEFIATLKAPPCAKPQEPVSLDRSGTRHLFQRFAPVLEDTANSPSMEQEARQKVLIVEDNMELALYIKRLLQKLCVAQVANDSEEASQLILNWMPDLIISDVMMPKKDGLALCREVKANPVTALIPVILLTALTDRKAMIDGWEAGADEYLFKPFHPNEVVARVKYMLESIRVRREIENNLKTAKDAAEGLNKEMQAFSYSVAHDLRTPLRKIGSFCEILETRLTDKMDAESREYFQKIQGSAIFMDRLIEDLLRLSRITQQQLKRELLDLSQLAGAIAEELRRLDPKRLVHFTIQPEISVYGDAAFMQIALRNLLENSWKFTSRRPNSKIEFGMREENKKKVFFVRDNGIGFDMAHANKLFNAFRRLHNPAQYPGTGIGLATVRRVIEMQGGKIWVESAVEQGTTFYFTLG